MRVTRLQLLLFIVGVLGAGAGAFYWMQQQPASIPPRSDRVPHSPVKISAPQAIRSSTTASSTPVATAEANSGGEASAKYIATVAAAYAELHERFGEIPSITNPLRAAKKQQAEGRFELAMASAKDAWKAIKEVQTTGAGVADSYTVTRGDTLWRIARDHSPVRQGPGWVAIWRANKKAIKNFDRIEIGWNLQIPPKPEDYVTRYWHPRVLARSHRHGPAMANAVSSQLAILHYPRLSPQTAPQWPIPLPSEIARALNSSEPRALPEEIVLALAPTAPPVASLVKRAPLATIVSLQAIPPVRVHLGLHNPLWRPALSPGAPLREASLASWSSVPQR